MNMEITIVKTFCDLAITFSKNSHFGHFYQDLGHKLRKNLAILTLTGLFIHLDIFHQFRSKKSDLMVFVSVVSINKKL